jgi:hypothetical protein
MNQALGVTTLLLPAKPGLAGTSSTVLRGAKPQLGGPSSGPVATGRAGSVIHSDQDPM